MKGTGRLASLCASFTRARLTANSDFAYVLRLFKFDPHCAHGSRGTTLMNYLPTIAAVGSDSCGQRLFLSLDILLHEDTPERSTSDTHSSLSSNVTEPTGSSFSSTPKEDVGCCSSTNRHALNPKNMLL